MKYKSLKLQKEKVLNIPDFEKGINLSRSGNMKEKGFLDKSNNIWVKNGKLQTRPTFTTNDESIIATQLEGGTGRHNFEFTDFVYYHDGEFKRIIYEKFYYDLSGYVVCVYLLSAYSGITNIGYMYFGRLDDSVFFTPENITFYVGKPQNGGGIFALVSLINEENYKDREYMIYEINSDLNEWETVINYYIPTVYINGRGNAYEMASQAINATLKGTPMELETPNLLNGSFYAYYSSDGYSHSFRLPYSNLADKSVVCRIHESPTRYTEWIIPAGEVKVTQSFSGANVTANLDRAKGIINFTVEAGTYPIPTMDLYCENNIRFMASLDIPNGKEEVISSSCAVNAGSRIVFSGGIAKNKLFYTEYDNPLYFPRNTEGYIGFSDSEVLRLVSAGERIIALKNSGVFSVTVKNGKSINNTALLSDNDSIFFKKDSFTVKCIEKNGTASKKTVKYKNGKVFWLGTDGVFYSMSSTGKIENMTFKIKDYFKELFNEYFDSAVCVMLDNFCLLFFEEKAVIINTENEQIFFWNLPEGFRVVDGFEQIGKNCFVMENRSENLYFMARLHEGKESLIYKGKLTDFPLETEIKTPRYNLKGLRGRSRITKVLMQLFSSDDVDIRIGTDENLFADFHIDRAEFNGTDDVITLCSDLNRSKWFELYIKSKGQVSLGEIETYYTEFLN